MWVWIVLFAASEVVILGAQKYGRARRTKAESSAPRRDQLRDPAEREQIAGLDVISGRFWRLGTYDTDISQIPVYDMDTIEMVIERRRERRATIEAMPPGAIEADFKRMNEAYERKYYA